MKKIICSFLFLSFVLAFFQSNGMAFFTINPLVPDANGTLYVKKGSTGNGSSWGNAVPELADALVAAKTNTAIKEIWVAMGTYKPLYSPADDNFGNPAGRDNAFLLVKDVKVYGGFPDTGSPNLNERNFTGNPTILSGDIGTAGNRSDNAHHVVISVGATRETALNGFTITGGNADGMSGGVTVNGSSIISVHGGGMFNYSSNPTLIDVTVNDNAAFRGGGIYNAFSSPELTNGALTNNAAINGTSSGGGIYNISSSPALTNVRITGNTAGLGGGMFCHSSNPVLINCLLNSNSAVVAAAVHNDIGSRTKLINCTIAGHTGNGGLFYNGSTATQISNSIIFSNTTASLFNWGGAGSNNLVQGSAEASNITAAKLFTDLSNNNYTLRTGSPAIGTGDNVLYEAADGNTANANLTNDKDLAGSLRLQKNTIDMGAYESPFNRAPVPDVNGIVYVKLNGAGNFKGDSWANAAAELADALLMAKSNTAIKQVWVAGGIYKPLYSPADNNFGIPAGRDNAFLMVKDVQIYGGFAGTETSLVQRDLSLAANKSILSGDFTGDDAVSGSGATLSITGNGENACHVVVAAGAIGTGSLDGFTITGGNANQVLPVTINLQQIFQHRAGGLYLVNSAPELGNLSFLSNQAETGGAIYTGGNAVVKISKTVFTENLAKTGAAVSSENSDNLLLSFCQFTANASLNGSNGYGGAIISAGGRLYVQNCLFRGNAASASGGAIWAEKIAVLSNSSFTGNSSLDAGAAIFIRGINLPGGLTIPVVNCSFTNNQSPNSAVFDWPLTTSNAGSTFEINFINSIIHNGDNSIRLGSIPRASFMHAILQQSGTLTPAFTLDAASVSLRNQDPLFTDANGADNIFGTADDNLSLKPGSPAGNAGDNANYEAADGNTGNSSLNQDKDLADNPRLVGATIDIGAYESAIQTQTINPITEINKTYGDAPFEPGATTTSGLTVSYASADNAIAEAFQDAADGSKWKLNIKKAGNVNITASQAGNNGFDPAVGVVFNLMISKRPVTVSIRSTAAFSKVYDANTTGAIQASDLMFASDDVINNDDVQLTLSAATAQYDNKDAGNGKTINLPIADVLLNGAQAGNYRITNVQDLSSSAAAITPMPLTITANNASKVYDGFAYTGGNGVSYSAFALGENAALLSGTLTYSGTAQNAMNTGAYAIIPAGLSSPNYAITYVNGQLNISLNNVNTLAFNAQTTGSTLVKTYGDADINASAIASSGLAANYQSSNTAVAAVNALGQVTLIGPGTATITADQSGDANYGPAIPVSFQVQVAKKLLSVTANDFSKTYDGIPYAGGNELSYNGFVNGDGPAALTGTVTYSGTSQGAINTGAYLIVPAGLMAARYDFDYRNGTLRILSSGANVITFNAQVAGSTQQLTYGQTNINGTALASSGLPVIYSSSNPAVAAVAANGTVQILAAGTATITATQPGDVNHVAAAPAGFNIIVQKKSLTITARNVSKTYDGNTYSGGAGVNYTGFIAGENESSLHGTLSYAGTAQGEKNVGSYFISPGGYTSGNYAISYQDGSLTITKAPLNIVAEAKSKVYGSGDPVLTYTSAGLKGTDVLTGNLLRAPGENADTYNIGQGSLNAGGNYSLNYTASGLTVTKALLTVTAEDKQMCQGTGLPAFSATYSGFKYSDGPAGLNTPVQFVSSGGSSAAPGNYTISANAAAAANYTFSYVTGTLKINPLPVLSVGSDKGSSISKGETAVLTATGGNSYVWTGADGIIGIANTAMLTVRPGRTTAYTVTATNASGCTESKTFTLAVNEDFAKIKATNILTPNNDGYNDRWVIDNIDFHPDNEVKVFDKAGRFVYGKRGYDNSWEGTCNGTALGEGTYYYVIDFGTGSPKFKGYITIVRED